MATEKIPDPSSFRQIGSILKPFGVDGRFLIYLESDFPDWLLQRREFFACLEGQWQAIPVESSRLHKKTLCLKLRGIDSPERVKQLRGLPLHVPEKDARELIEPGYYYHSDLVGLQVVDSRDQRSYGHVVEVLETPGHSVLRIEGESTSFLLPFTMQHVPSVDIEGGRILVALPPGLLDLP